MFPFSQDPQCVPGTNFPKALAGASGFEYVHGGVVEGSSEEFDEALRMLKDGDKERINRLRRGREAIAAAHAESEGRRWARERPAVVAALVEYLRRDVEEVLTGLPLGAARPPENIDGYRPPLPPHFNCVGMPEIVEALEVLRFTRPVRDAKSGRWVTDELSTSTLTRSMPPLYEAYPHTREEWARRACAQVRRTAALLMAEPFDKTVAECERRNSDEQNLSTRQLARRGRIAARRLAISDSITTLS